MLDDANWWWHVLLLHCEVNSPPFPDSAVQLTGHTSKPDPNVQDLSWGRQHLPISNDHN